MSQDGFQVQELDAYTRHTLKVVAKELPKECKKFVGREGSKLKNRTVKKAKSKVKLETGDYFKGIKKGKVYIYGGNGGISVRTYGGKPAFHAHLLEYGHRQVTHDGQEVGFVPGYHIFEESKTEFEPIFNKDIEKFLEKAVAKL